jgi:hypothetical protein
MKILEKLLMFLFKPWSLLVAKRINSNTNPPKCMTTATILTVEFRNL